MPESLFCPCLFQPPIWRAQVSRTILRRLLRTGLPGLFRRFRKGFHFVTWKIDSMFAGMRREVEIVNKLGLHARPAARFVRWASRFKSTITIWRDEEKFSAASLLEVLTANLDCGARVVLEAIG